MSKLRAGKVGRIKVNLDTTPIDNTCEFKTEIIYLGRKPKPICPYIEEINKLTTPFGARFDQTDDLDFNQAAKSPGGHRRRSRYQRAATQQGKSEVAK